MCSINNPNNMIFLSFFSFCKEHASDIHHDKSRINWLVTLYFFPINELSYIAINCAKFIPNINSTKTVRLFTFGLSDLIHVYQKNSYVIPRIWSEKYVHLFIITVVEIYSNNHSPILIYILI